MYHFHPSPTCGYGGETDRLSMDEDPLARLLVDETELNRGLLADVLEPYAVITKESGNPVFKPAYNELSAANKIVVFLLSRKASKALGRTAREEATPKEIAASTGVKYDTVKPTVSDLNRDRVLAKNGEAYFVPDYSVLTMKDRLGRKTTPRISRTPAEVASPRP